jgi:CubicO group peptidase (beta-lactamase class C family)
MTDTARPWPCDAPDYRTLAAAVQGEAARWNVPGMTAAILHDGARTVAATGLTSLDHPVPVTPDTRFQVGSITKVFTATAIMVLVERGTLDLDAPVTTWVPDLPLAHRPALETLSLRHLLNHTTGFEGDVFFDTGPGEDALAESVTRFGRLRHWTAPGEVFAYCNTGFALAGRVIELVTGQPYEEALAELVLAPLGLQHTVFPSPDLATWPVASGHTLKDRETGYRVYRPWAIPRASNAAGGIVSTAGDLLTFAEMHLRGGTHDGTRLVCADTAAAMRERTSRLGVLDAGYGVGWSFQHAGEVILAGHGGATNGFRAHLVTVPERGFALAMLTNGDPGSSAMEAVRRWALRRYLDIDMPQRETIEEDARTLDAVAGRYCRHDAAIEIARADDHLRIERRTIEHEDQFSHERAEGDPPTVIEAWPTGEGVYRVLDGPFRDALIEFFDTRLYDDRGALVSRPVMRSSGRIAEREGRA